MTATLPQAPAARTGLPAAIDAIGTVVQLELRQRVRSTAWYVLLGVSAALLAVVTGLLLVTSAAFGRQVGGSLFPMLVFFVLLLGTLVTPALSGGAVNADRDAGTLATTQVTLVTAGQLVIGKFLASWTAALAFLAVAVPFLLVAVIAGGVSAGVAATSLAVTVLELGVVAAVGVGLSALLQRTIFSVVTTYLVVAALSIGTLIVFGLGGLAFPQTVTTTTQYLHTDSDGNATGSQCDPATTSQYTEPSYWRVWGVLAVNPYVVLADAVPATFDANGPTNLFASVQVAERSAQLAQPDHRYYSDCHKGRNTPDMPSGQAVLDRTVPSWFVGLGFHLLLAAAALVAATRALRTPARRLARGSRIA